MNTYFLDGKSLTVADLDKIVSQKYEIQLSEEAELDVLKGRQAVQEMMSDPNKVVYGINTGFGNFFDKVISLDDRKLLQINLIRSHAVGVGKPVPT
jgi:histidine ammonia-lyase